MPRRFTLFAALAAGILIAPALLAGDGDLTNGENATSPTRAFQDPSQNPPENGQKGANSPSGLPNPFQDPRDRIYYPDDTERPKPLATKLISNILLDQKEIWLSPFHMRKQDSKWWIGFGAVTATLIATDRKTSKLLENSPGQVSWGNRVSKVGAAYTVIPITAAFYGIGVGVNNAQARETGVLGAEALLDSLIVVSALKPVGGRIRPDSTTGERSQFFDGGDSFPSGHAIESWALASVIAHEYKHRGGKFVPYAAYGLAAVVSAARFAAQKHYASDIVAGAGMGWFIGRYVYQTHQDHASHPHAWSRPQIVPSMDPATRSYVVSIRAGI
ncbi:MAG TPA: phosphatase PAP2 family protein [Bryobacteraceae bacterium]|jgi:membrane-associated phospholipid phosphatase